MEETKKKLSTVISKVKSRFFNEVCMRVFIFGIINLFRLSVIDKLPN